MPTMDTTTVAITTALTTFVTGYLFGLYTTRGYLVSPALSAERHANLHDPVESDESDVDELDSLLDHAPNWANAEAADVQQGLRARSLSSPSAAAAAAAAAKSTTTNEECKLVLVVRTDLGMTKGKIAAQCSHATLACYKAVVGGGQETKTLLSRWERGGQAKIALQVGGGRDELLALCRGARAAGLVAEMVHDAGRTQVEAGSATVLGVGPAPKSVVDKITGHLKLL